jgi:hypothetical protein
MDSERPDRRMVMAYPERFTEDIRSIANSSPSTCTFDWSVVTWTLCRRSFSAIPDCPHLVRMNADVLEQRGDVRVVDIDTAFECRLSGGLRDDGEWIAQAEVVNNELGVNGPCRAVVAPRLRRPNRDRPAVRTLYPARATGLILGKYGSLRVQRSGQHPGIARP